MRISDWSSDVCSSDLLGQPLGGRLALGAVELVAAPVLAKRRRIERDQRRAEDRRRAERRARDQDLAVEPRDGPRPGPQRQRLREIGRAHSELQSLMRSPDAVFSLKKQKKDTNTHNT